MLNIMMYTVLPNTYCAKSVHSNYRNILNKVNFFSCNKEDPLTHVPKANTTAHGLLY